MNAAEIAREAARIVEARGLFKGGFSDEKTGAVCMWGAIRAALDDEYLEDGLVPLRDAIASRVGVARRAVDFRFPGAGWNDEPDTTATDVAKLLLQVADDLEVTE